MRIKKGDRFGSLLVIQESLFRKNRNRYYDCVCACGNKTTVVGTSLTRKNPTTSCGCFHARRLVESVTKHGCRRKIDGNFVSDPTYVSWIGMNQRCYNPKSVGFKYYGSRGIGVCRSWRGSDGFASFLSDMGKRPVGFTLERKNINLDYSAGNCYWADCKTQTRNRRITRFVCYQGEERPLAEVAECLGIRWRTLYSRMFNYGWSVERATATPVRKTHEARA